MKILALNHPLGMGRGAGMERDTLAVGVSQPKLWILSAIGAGVGLASSLFGGISASKAAKEAERRQRQQEASERAWYNRRYNEDYVDTAAGQNLVSRAKDYARENWRKAQGAQAVAGGTDAATAMAKEAGNKMVGDTIADIAATDQERKSHVDDMHRKAESQFAQMDMNREMQRAQNITNAAQGASNAIMSMAGAVDQTKPNLHGGSNNSKVTSPAVAPNAITQAATGTGERFNADLKDSNGGSTTSATTPTDDEYRHFRQAVEQ